MKRVKVATGHAAHARFLQHIDEVPIGQIPRQRDIPSPYAFSPVDIVWNWKGKRIIGHETSHARFEFFEIPTDMTISPVED